MKTFTKPKNQTHTPALVLAAVFSVSISVPTTPATAAETMGALKSMSITDAQAANKPPLISFKTSVNGATITFDATGSTDPDGTIQEYKWDFGDGSTGSGATISHTFSADPAPVTLTAIDDKGGVAIAQTEIQGYTEPFEIIVDDADSSRFTTVGAWAVSTSSPGYYNTGYKTAPAGTGSSTGRAASSPNLLTPLLPDLLVENSFRFSKGNDWYTGSTTPYSGVKKLFPNCSLELKTGRIKRYWPKPSDFQFTHNTTDGKIQKICDLLKGGISSALAQGQVLCSITGGQDSRVVLAACKDSWQAIDFFTIKADWVARDDISLAALLAKTTSINHKFIDYASTPAWLDELYNEIGANESIGARREIAGTCLQLEGHNKIHINGNLGALCKSYYWHNTHPKEFKISAVTRDFIDPGKIIFDGISEWVSTIVEIKEAHILYNLFYLEQRGGRWISAGENCSRLFYESFTPFNHREIFCLISSLPLELQCSGKLLKIFVQKLAPELLHVSYCRTRRKYSKYIPEKFKNKLRKLFKR